MRHGHFPDRVYSTPFPFFESLGEKVIKRKKDVWDEVIVDAYTKQERPSVFTELYPNTDDIRRLAAEVKSVVDRGVLSWNDLSVNEELHSKINEATLSEIVKRTAFINRCAIGKKVSAIDVLYAVKAKEYVDWREIGFANEAEFNSVKTEK